MQQFMQSTMAVDQKLDCILNLFQEHVQYEQKVTNDTMEMKAGIEH